MNKKYYRFTTDEKGDIELTKYGLWKVFDEIIKINDEGFYFYEKDFLNYFGMASKMRYFGTFFRLSSKSLTTARNEFINLVFEKYGTKKENYE